MTLFSKISVVDRISDITGILRFVHSASVVIVEEGSIARTANWGQNFVSEIVLYQSSEFPFLVCVVEALTN